MARMIDRNISYTAISQIHVVSLFLVLAHPLIGALPSDGLDTSIVVALIGLGGVIGGGLIAGAFPLYSSARLAEKTGFLRKE
jgi:hypothetical protein